MATTHEPPTIAAPPAAPATPRTRRATVSLVAHPKAGLALALLLAASLSPAPARAREAPPTPATWLDALAAVQRQPRAYHGNVGSRSLHIGLGLPGPDGRFDGTAVLLDTGNHLVARGPVHGRITAHQCRLRLDLGDITAHVVGACRPDTLTGMLDEVRHEPFSLIRLLYAKGSEHVLGEVWLTAGP